MKIPFKTTLFLVLLLVLVPLAWFFGYRFSMVDRHTEISKEIILERVENVVKLGTVEGVFSEIYDYSDLEYYNISPGLLPNIFHSRKKALIRVRARVLVGYDMDSLDVNLNSITKKILIKELPLPKIISIDHDMEYYDIENGYFNKFSKEDYNMIQKQAKEFIREKALESDLFPSADKQIMEHLSTLNWLLKDAGWEIRVKEARERKFWN